MVKKMNDNNDNLIMINDYSSLQLEAFNKRIDRLTLELEEMKEKLSSIASDQDQIDADVKRRTVDAKLLMLKQELKETISKRDAFTKTKHGSMKL